MCQIQKIAKVRPSISNISQIGGTRSPTDRHIDKKNAPLHNKKCIPHYLLCHLSINFEFPYIDTVFCRTKVLKFLFMLLLQI